MEVYIEKVYEDVVFKKNVIYKLIITQILYLYDL